jgi:hypothetical protein
LSLTLECVHINSGCPILCKTSDAVCATWYARSTSRLPSAWISTGGAFPPSSWVRWPSSSWVRQSSGCYRGSDELFLMIDSNHHPSSSQQSRHFAVPIDVRRVQNTENANLYSCMNTCWMFNVCKMYIVVKREGSVFVSCLHSPLTEWPDS